MPFGHAFDKRGLSLSKSAVRVGGLSVFDQPSRSGRYSGCRAAHLFPVASQRFEDAMRQSRTVPWPAAAGAGSAALRA